jgi:hypothetical protein
MYMQLATLRKTEIGYEVPPAIYFAPNPGEAPSREPLGKVEPTTLKKELAKPDHILEFAVESDMSEEEHMR